MAHLPGHFLEFPIPGEVPSVARRYCVEVIEIEGTYCAMLLDYQDDLLKTMDYAAHSATGSAPTPEEAIRQLFAHR